MRCALKLWRQTNEKKSIKWKRPRCGHNILSALLIVEFGRISVEISRLLCVHFGGAFRSSRPIVIERHKSFNTIFDGAFLINSHTPLQKLVKNRSAMSGRTSVLWRSFTVLHCLPYGQAIWICCEMFGKWWKLRPAISDLDGFFGANGIYGWITHSKDKTHRSLEAEWNGMEVFWCMPQWRAMVIEMKTSLLLATSRWAR